jgi:hypothetical protein
MISLFSRKTEYRTESYFDNYLKSAERKGEADCEVREMEAEIGMLKKWDVFAVSRNREATKVIYLQRYGFQIALSPPPET